MKRFLSLTILLFVSLFLFASVTQRTSLDALQYSALESIAYYGTLTDIFQNPASLAFVQNDTAYAVSGALSESYLGEAFREPMGFLQNLNGESCGTVLTPFVSLSAKFSNQFDDKHVFEDGDVQYDVYSSIDLEIDLARSFLKYFSVGARLSGGNSMVRLNKTIDNPLVAVENAWFSPYESITGSERYTLGAGALAAFSHYTVAFFADGFSLDLPSFNVFFNQFLRNSSVSLAYQGSRYKETGDLRLLVPRASFTYKGFAFNTIAKELSVKGDITLQFLKDILLDGGMGYTYTVREDGISSALAFSLYGEIYEYGLSLNMAYTTEDEVKRFVPSIVFTYSN